MRGCVRGKDNSYPVRERVRGRVLQEKKRTGGKILTLVESGKLINTLLLLAASRTVTFPDVAGGGRSRKIRNDGG